MVFPVTRFAVVPAAGLQSRLMECLHPLNRIRLERQVKVSDRRVSSRDVEFVEIEAGIIGTECITLAECVENRAVKGFALFEI